MRDKDHTAKVKRIVDICLTVLLLCLMAYQVTGETLHEWLGMRDYSWLGLLNRFSRTL